jgi:hypothetical protein
MNLRKLCSLLAVALAGCGGSTSSPVLQSQAAAKLAEAYCVKLYACCAGNTGSTTLAACESAYTNALQAGLSAQINDTKVSYDADATGACVSEISASSTSCEELLIQPRATACNRLTVGTVATGGACATAFECKSQLCEGIQGGMGTCVAPAGVGGSCLIPQGTTDGEVCDNSSYVAESSDGSSCTCTALKGNGASVDYYTQCQSDYAPTTSTPSTCAPYPQLSSLPAAVCQQLTSSIN